MATPSSSLDLLYYFNKTTFSDVKLYTKSKMILANSIVLALNSSVFKHIIEDKNEKDIFLDSFLDEEDEMKMIISSFYLRSNLVITAGTLFTVAKFGLTYNVEWVTGEALRFVNANMSHDNCIDICRVGYKLKENFRYPTIFNVSLEFLKNSKYLEEIVVRLEMIEEENSFLSIPASMFHNLLQNKLRRDENRIVNLVERWFKRDSNVIQAMVILPLLQLSQLYLVNQDLHASFFEYLLSSEKLTSEDKKTILEMFAKSITDSKSCLVTGKGFSREIPMQIQEVKHIKVILESLTWLNCSFEDVVMMKQFSGVNEYIFLEMVLVWSATNQPTENQLKTILGMITLTEINSEYIHDLLEHLQHYIPHLPDHFGSDLVARYSTIDLNSITTHLFTSQTLTSDQIKNMKLKKHSLTERPCGVRGCWNRSLGVVELRLRADSLPFYKTAGGRTGSSSNLEHSHNGDVWHVYFRVGLQIVSCYCDSWSSVDERISGNDVVVKVVCRGVR